jgi:hypothetical protein
MVISQPGLASIDYISLVLSSYAHLFGKAASTTEGFEVVGAGDSVNITWKQLTGMGLKVMYLV